MSSRKRVNISIDSKTYEMLQRIKEAHGFSNVCELVVAFVHILLDRMEIADKRKYDLPDDDGKYIDEMFDDLGHTERTPYGDAPVRRRIKRIK